MDFGNRLPAVLTCLQNVAARFIALGSHLIENVAVQRAFPWMEAGATGRVSIRYRPQLQIYDNRKAFVFNRDDLGS
jgi:hypothetical protein